MAGRSKIVNENEVIRWMEEGKTYQWIVEEYRRKYNVETTLSMWGNFRRRRGLDRRITRDDDLIPWFVKKEHRWTYPIMQLRAEARRRAGHELDPDVAHKVDVWISNLKADGLVVHYDPDSEEGFQYVPARKKDTDLIRVPDHKTTVRPNADEQ